MCEILLFAIKIGVRFEDLGQQRSQVKELSDLERPFEMPFRFVKLAPVQMKACDVQMADRLLRHKLVRLAVAKDPVEPPESLAKIAPQSRRKRQVVGY